MSKKYSFSTTIANSPWEGAVFGGEGKGKKLIQNNPPVLKRNVEDSADKEGENWVERCGRRWQPREGENQARYPSTGGKAKT